MENGIHSFPCSDRSQAKFMVQSTVSGSGAQFAPVRSYMDSLGRTIRTRTRAFDSSNFIHTDVQYDARGRVFRSSDPYFAGAAPVWNTPSYDALSRHDVPP